MGLLCLRSAAAAPARTLGCLSMRNPFFRAALLAAVVGVATPALASIDTVSYATELSRTDVVPPFGSYTSDVLIRRGSIARGQFRFDSDTLSFSGDPAVAPRLHLENYRHYNDDDGMPLYIANEGWSIAPTNWVVDLGASQVEIDAAGRLHFLLRTCRGLDMYSENRPFRFAGDTAKPKDLSWIAIGDESSTWRHDGVLERIGAVDFTVTLIPEPGTAALARIWLLCLAKRGTAAFTVENR